jgi:hypothetical protein
MSDELVNRYIGAPIERVEDLRFLRGPGEYVADLARQRMLHAAILRSPVAHARIRALDPKPALAIGGVGSGRAVAARRRPCARLPSVETIDRRYQSPRKTASRLLPSGSSTNAA